MARLDDCIETAFRRAAAARYVGWSKEDAQVVVLAGQGSKVFSVSRHLRDLFGARLVDRHQESAVIEGLAVYTGVLGGRLRDVLILDSNYSTIAVACTPAHAASGGGDATVSGNPESNSSLFTLIAAGAFIPIIPGNYYTVKAIETRQRVCELSIVELGARTGERFAITSVPVRLPDRKDVVEIGVRVDANRTITLAARARDSQTWQVTRLNNHFKEDSPKTRTVRAGSRHDLERQLLAAEIVAGSS